MRCDLRTPIPKQLLVCVCALAAFAAAPQAAGAAIHEVHLRNSQIFHADEASYNWSGYAITGASFSDITSTWTLPAVTCTDGVDSFSSFWVGLGGYAPGSLALEQEGTDADCYHGQTIYEAWYEIIPAPPVTIGLTVNAGDTVSTHIDVTGQTVLFQLNDLTDQQSYSQSFQITGAVDTSSAEWIAEAPSTCDGGDLSSCHPMPLANYGQVTFSGSTATANGQTGSISAPTWTASSIELDGTDGVSSLPSPLSADGTAFTTEWNDVGQSNVPPAPESAAPAPAAPVTTTPTTTTPAPVTPVAQPKPTKPAPAAKPKPAAKHKAKPKAKVKPRAKKARARAKAKTRAKKRGVHF